MKPTVFRNSVDSVRDYLKCNEKIGALPNGFLDSEVRVAICLSIGAGTSDLHLMYLWHIASQNFYQAFDEAAKIEIRVHKMYCFHKQNQHVLQKHRVSQVRD